MTTDLGAGIRAGLRTGWCAVSRADAWLRLAGILLRLGVAVGVATVLGLAGVRDVAAQAVTTTTVQGTVYLANGTPGSGTVLVSWPAFTTASNQSVAAGSTVVMVGADGFLSVNLAPNANANPAGLYYTAVFHLADGTVSTQYWVIPAAATATLASIQATVMPAAQAVQTVSKAYVDQAIAELQASLLTASGGTLTGPLTLCCDPTTPLMAADKRYVDEVAGTGLAGGGTVAGGLNAYSLNGVYAPEAGSSQATLQATQAAAVAAGGSMQVSPNYAGTDTFTNAVGIRVEDLRSAPAQQHERSVKEFGAVCDGVTNDTAALQAAINYAQSRYAAGTAVSLTGSYVKAVGGAWDSSGVWTLRGVANALILGSTGAGAFPAGSGTWEVAAKADTAATQELKLVGTTGSGSGSCVFADLTVSLTTGWQIFRIPYNTVTGNSACDSATAGHAVPEPV